MPEKEVAAPTGTGAADLKQSGKSKQSHRTTNAAESLLEKAAAVARDGELREFVPGDPAWYRRIGGDVFGTLTVVRDLDPHRRRRVEFVYRLASARRAGVEIGPFYQGPTHRSVEQARAALQAAFEEILVGTLDYHAATMRLAA